MFCLHRNNGAEIGFPYRIQLCRLTTDYRITQNDDQQSVNDEIGVIR
jgi:hypothetical protein